MFKKLKMKYMCVYKSLIRFFNLKKQNNIQKNTNVIWKNNGYKIFRDSHKCVKLKKTVYILCGKLQALSLKKIVSFLRVFKSKTRIIYSIGFQPIYRTIFFTTKQCA